MSNPAPHPDDAVQEKLWNMLTKLENDARFDGEFAYGDESEPMDSEKREIVDLFTTELSAAEDRAKSEVARLLQDAEERGRREMEYKTQLDISCSQCGHLFHVDNSGSVPVTTPLAKREEGK